jgi:hypothetical protein
MLNATKILIKKRPVALAVSTLFAVGSVNAADFGFSGNIANHNDVIQINFSLASAATNVAVWTDSFMSAVNFDPITSVWSQSGSDYSLVGQNDDNASIRPGQTYFDSGLTFASLAAGNYLFTIGTYANFANGSLLSQGFSYDGQTPISLSTWCQPASHCGMGTFYNVHLSGVDSAENNTPGTPVSAVPEPETYAMLLAGLGFIGFMARRRNDINV